jgi:hypothetical protein
VIWPCHRLNGQGLSLHPKVPFRAQQQSRAAMPPGWTVPVQKNWRSEVSCNRILLRERFAGQGHSLSETSSWSLPFRAAT